MDSDDEEELLSQSRDSRAENEEKSELNTSNGRILPRRPGPCRAKAGDGKATLWWAESEAGDAQDIGDDGDETLFSKTEMFVIYKYRLDGEEWQERGSHNRLEVKYPTTSITIDGLTNGRQFQFAVRARDRKGLSSQECIRSNVVIPFEPLPEPWTEHFDSNNGKTYYYNPETKQRTWTRPTNNMYKVGEENAARFQAREIAKFRLRFSEVDADESGQIDEHELMELMKELDTPINLQKARKMIRKVDSDGSGKIEFDEFLTMMWKFQSGELDGFKDKIGKFLDGSLAKNTAQSVLGKIKNKVGEKTQVERLHQQKMMEKERMGAWLEKFDEVKRRKYYFNKDTKEKSWKLPDEVQWFVPDELRGQFTHQEIELFEEQFTRFDDDQSGEMDADELTEAMRALGEKHISHKSVLALLREVDFDNSGQVNFAEFVQLMALRRERNKGIRFNLPFMKGNATELANQKTQIKNLKMEVVEVKKENKYLRTKVQTLEKEGMALRKKKFVFVPSIPIKEFLNQHSLPEYDEACGRYGIRDTSDLFRLEETDFTEELGFKLGHKRKILAALKRLEEKMTD